MQLLIKMSRIKAFLYWLLDRSIFCEQSYIAGLAGLLSQNALERFALKLICLCTILLRYLSCTNKAISSKCLSNFGIGDEMKMTRNLFTFDVLCLYAIANYQLSNTSHELN